MKQAAVKIEDLSPSCGSCRCWKAEEEGGMCRRNPPSVHALTDDNGTPYTISSWPMTDATDWCGEWRAGQ